MDNQAEASKLKVYKIKVQIQVMDMSAGDCVDGPRWSGRFNDIYRDVHVVAPNEELAKAAISEIFCEVNKPKVMKCKCVCDVNCLIQLQA